ncbi:MAG: GNAT family N-acetyltransferase [Clostridia bacterium]|nr:GNAT family N-acetyltransferase [Clostridia bacterium]
MRRVKNGAELFSRIDLVFPDVKLTNGIPDRETLGVRISRGDLYEMETDGGLLLLTRADGFFRLNYILTDPSALYSVRPDATVAVETAYRAADRSVDDTFDRLGKLGWRDALRRVRLTRPAGGDIPQGGGFDPYSPTAAEARAWLEACFSPLTGCLPDLCELEDDLEEDRLIAADGALLRFREVGAVSEIRHLAVLADRRRRGLARALLARFLELRGGKRCRVWTGADNSPALSLYENFGFVPDGMKSRVMIFE